MDYSRLFQCYTTSPIPHLNCKVQIYFKRFGCKDEQNLSISIKQIIAINIECSLYDTSYFGIPGIMEIVLANFPRLFKFQSQSISLGRWKVMGLIAKKKQKKKTLNSQITINSVTIYIIIHENTELWSQDSIPKHSL